MDHIELPGVPGTADGDTSTLVGVRDRLRAELGGDPVTWHLVERVLAVVEDVGRDAPSDGTPPPRDPAEEERRRAAVRRGLAPETTLEDLLDHERAAGRTLTIADFSRDMQAAAEELGTLRAALTAVEDVLATLRESPGLTGGGGAEEALRWVLGLLESALSPASPLLDDRLLAERHRVADVAAVMAGLRGLDRAAFVARVLDASNEAPP